MTHSDRCFPLLKGTEALLFQTTRVKCQFQKYKSNAKQKDSPAFCLFSNYDLS